MCACRWTYVCVTLLYYYIRTVCIKIHTYKYVHVYVTHTHIHAQFNLAVANTLTYQCGSTILLYNNFIKVFAHTTKPLNYKWWSFRCININILTPCHAVGMTTVSLRCTYRLHVVNRDSRMLTICHVPIAGFILRSFFTQLWK